jgi:hypothetical protein
VREDLFQPFAEAGGPVVDRVEVMVRTRFSVGVALSLGASCLRLPLMVSVACIGMTEVEIGAKVVDVGVNTGATAAVMAADPGTVPPDEGT